MTLTLYFAAGSPPSRSCLLLAKTLKLEIEVKNVNLAAGEQNTPEFLKLNPLHQVPVLVDGDFVLTEGRAILGYLINKFSPESSLYPSDPQKRAKIDQRLYYDATVVFESAAQIIRTVLYQQVKKIPNEQKERLSQTLCVLENFLSNSKWFAGDDLTIADFSIVSSVTTVKELGYDLSRHPKLNEWHSRCEKFPGFEENLSGAKFLAQRMFAIMDDKL